MNNRVYLTFFTIILGLTCLAPDKCFAQINNLSDLEGKRIGILEGSAFERVTNKKIKNAFFIRFNNYTNQVYALENNSIAAFVVDEPSAIYYIKNHDEFRIVEEHILDTTYAPIFSKRNGILRDDFNKAILKYEADGSMKELVDVWFGKNEALKVSPTLPKIGSRGIITVVTNSNIPPFVYRERFKLKGFEIALLAKFANDFNYGIKIVETDFNDIIPAVAGNTFDMGLAGFCITKDRAEFVLFSIPELKSAVVAVTK